MIQSPKYFLGIDVGSSKTHALIANEQGLCLGFGEAGGGNHQNVGYAGLENTLKESFTQALVNSKIRPDQIAGAGFGVSGFDFLSDRPGHLQAIRSLGLSCPQEVVNDGVNGLLAGATHGIGVNVTAGSSNNCRGRNKFGKEGRIVGNGTMFGENGGGIEITYKAFQMVNHAWIKRIPPTALTRIFLDATDARDELDLMEGVSSEKYNLTAAMAVEVLQAALAGDLAAQEVIQWAGEELGWLAVGVTRQIEMENEDVEIIQSGSIFNAGEIITAPMQRIILQAIPQARIYRLEGPPVVGAVILGMEQANFDGYLLRANMITSALDFMRDC